MKRTLGNVVREFYRNYIAPTEEEVKVGKKELGLVSPEDMMAEQKEKFLIKELSMVKCRQIATQCPLFMKAARKKAMDSIRAWHHLVTYSKKSVPAKIDLDYIRDFAERNNLRALWHDFKVAAYIYGDSYILITFENDKNTKIHEAPAEKATPWKIRILNSELIKDIDYYPKNKKYYQDRFIRHFHYVDVENNKDEWIHPNRILHLPKDKLPHKSFGTSKANLLRNIIKSTINVDIAVGEILAWFAHGSYDITQDNLKEPQRKKWEKIAKQHPGAWIHDETAKLEAINPQAIDPKPFYEYLVLCIAAAFQMPTHILTGIQVGKVTGAEVGTGDYVKDVKDEEDLEDSPLLRRLYKMILESHGRKWKYDIVWNPIYIDELSEAEILLKRVEAAELARNGKRGAGGFITDKEARRIFNEGQIELEADNVSGLRKPQPQEPKKDSKDDDEDDNDDDKSNLYKRQAEIADKALRERIEKQAAKEKQIGIRILLEQDKDDSDKNKGDRA